MASSMYILISMSHYFCCLLVLGPVGLINGEFTNLTTSKIVDTSAKPTTLMRRLDVRKEDYDANNARDIFTRSVSRRFRRFGKKVNDLWNWNHWCLLQPKIGDCAANETKYYYNAQLNVCERIMFTGCVTNANENQFDTIDSCEHHCKGTFLLLSENVPEEKHVCELQAISGRCVDYFLMYYYNVNEGKCKTFAYGGCAGNQNKFSTEDECVARCGKKTPLPSSYEDSVDTSSNYNSF